ncbi:hypothetical protein L3Q82_006787 [Scortum barcoo]|uniref:Uncharacterized protein n=1 Tax=Scortum barcoo TaxID=214431 RepID=A0ACB8WVS7_9TELE|nr:hypothetical protein L3Q82_006787 [Scortum barcoo]
MAPWVDEIRPEYLKSLDVVVLSWQTRLCNIAWRSGTVPLEWQTGVVVPLFKKGDRRVCSNYRGSHFSASREGLLTEQRLMSVVSAGLHMGLEQTSDAFFTFHFRLKKELVVDFNGKQERRFELWFGLNDGYHSCLLS